mgnify:CR=1 FL=1
MKMNSYCDLDTSDRENTVKLEKMSNKENDSLMENLYEKYLDLGYNKDQVNNIAAQFLKDDLPNEDGEILKRKARYSDYFVEPYENNQIAKISNNGAYPPDLSLMVKARKDGANYIRSLLLP